MNDDLEILRQLLDERDEDIERLLDAIRDIYTTCGEDPDVAKKCNEVLESHRFSS